jgi:hypothetical protein
MTQVRMKRHSPNYDQGQIGTLGRPNATAPGIYWIEFGTLRHGSTGCWCGPEEYEVLPEPTTQFPTGLRCISCGNSFDRFTPAAGAPATPTGGELCLCMHCGELAIWVQTSIGLTLRTLTAAERETALADDEIVAVSAAIIFRNLIRSSLPFQRPQGYNPNGDPRS